MDSNLDVSVAIDLELFQWSANKGRDDRLLNAPMLTKAMFLNSEAVSHIGHELKLDMYRAYRVGFTKALVAVGDPNGAS